MNMNMSLTIPGGKTLHALMSLILGETAPVSPALRRHERNVVPHPSESVRGTEDSDGAMSDLSLEREEPEPADPDDALCRLSLSREEPGANDPNSSMSWLSLSWDEPEPKTHRR
jgi:hypothetical protein